MTSTRRGGGQAQVDACGRGRGQALCGRPHIKFKIESTDVILSSSHAKKLASLLPEFRPWTEQKVEFFRRYKFVIKITNSTVLNNLQSYNRISALGPEGHCTSRIKRAMCISCRPCVDVHKGVGGLAHVDRGRGKSPDFCGRHKWMAPYQRLSVSFSCRGFHL